MKIQCIVLLLFLQIQNVQAQTLVTTPDKWTIQPAFGFGTSTLGMRVAVKNKNINYATTNNNFSFISINYEDLSMAIKFPNSDPESSRLTKGDTKSTDFQFCFGFKENWQAELYYQKYKSYYMDYEKTAMVNPDLSLSHTGAQLIYAFNKLFSPAMQRDSHWKQDSSGGSWTLGVGFDQFDLEGDLVPKQFGISLKDSLKYAKADSLTLRGSYGYNWIWTHWYAGASFGMGPVISQIKYKYLAEPITTTDFEIVSNVGFSLGYAWTKTKLGVFGRAYQWGMAFDDKKLTSNTSLSGFYISSVF